MKVHSINREALRLLTTSLLLCMVCFVANAYDFKENDIYYNILSEEELTCEVTYLSTSNSNYSAYQGSVVIPNTVEYNNVTYAVRGINDSAFSGCTALTEITIPNSVTTIGSYAFYQCSGLTEITIPNSVTYIGSYAFYQCKALTEITIPNSVTYIGSYAFYQCSGLTEVTIGESVTSIGTSAFYGCKGLMEVTIGNSVTTIGSSAFRYCSGLTEITIPNSVTEIGKLAFYQCTGLTGELIIPNSVTSIGENAFYQCSGLTEVIIGEGVTSIGSYAFDQCTGLTEVNFNAVACTSAGSYYSNRAFYGCSNITTFNFGDNVTIIPAYLCYSRTGLTSVTIPNSVTTIGSETFYGCTGLTSIYSLNPEPPTCGSNVFYNVDKSTCVLYVPEGSLGAYANASTWSSFYNIVEIEVDAIADITTNGNAEAVGYYTLDGKQVPTPQRGINIIRYSDGTAKKVLVK